MRRRRAAGGQRAEVADRAGGGRGGQRRVDAQCLADRAVAAGRAVAARGRQPVPAGGELGVRHGQAQLPAGNVDLDPVAVGDSAIIPPAAASGATWQTDRPDVPPENRPSVISAQARPRPLPLRKLVG